MQLNLNRVSPFLAKSGFRYSPWDDEANDYFSYVHAWFMCNDPEYRDSWKADQYDVIRPLPKDVCMYKKASAVRRGRGSDRQVIIRLLVPAGAFIRFQTWINIYDPLHDRLIHKCRVNMAIPSSFHWVSGHEWSEEEHKEYDVYSNYNKSFTYEIGVPVFPHYSFDKRAWNECGSGIHVFATACEAKHW